MNDCTLCVRIGALSIEVNEGWARLQASVMGPDGAFPLWFEVEVEHATGLCVERSDAFLVALLPWAMMQAHKRKVSVELQFETGISESLLHQVNCFLVPALCRQIGYYKPVDIQATAIPGILESIGAVGTGISGGVDSSYTIAKYKDSDCGGFQLTHGVYYSIGIYGGFNGFGERLLEQKARAIASSTGLKFFVLRSNCCLALYDLAHAPIVPFVFMGCALAMQKLFSTYYYSSGFGLEDFHVSDVDAAYFDLLSVQCFSTLNTRFYSSGLETSRLEKVEFISKHAFTYEYLSVCLSEAQGNGNCGRCAKCTRTMAELDTLGVLERYDKVFDLKWFYDNAAYHWGYVLLKSRTDAFCSAIVKARRERGLGVPCAAYWGCLSKWVRRGFTSANRQRRRVDG